MKMTATSQTLEVKIGEAVSTVAPTREIEATEVVAATLVLIASPSTLEAGNFTTSYATACAAPGVNNQKGVTRLHFANPDSVAHTFYLRRNTGGTFTYFLAGQQLQPGEFATYEVGHGWAFFDAQGNRK
jgi:hypothetical protein